MTSVSVIMPAFNAARFIADAVKSVLGQGFSDLELIVVDDGSLDETAATARAAGGGDVRLHLLPRSHAGVSAARNEGLAAARGEFLTFLDADDLWPEQRLERHVAKLSKRPGSILAGHIVIFDAEQPPDRNIPDSLLSVNLGAATFRRSLFTEFGGFDPALKFFEDLDMFLRLHDQGVTIGTESEVSLFHRRHATNMSLDLEAGRPFMLHALRQSMLRRRKGGITNMGRPFPLLTPNELVAAVRNTVKSAAGAAEAAS